MQYILKQKKKKKMHKTDAQIWAISVALHRESAQSDSEKLFSL